MATQSPESMMKEQSEKRRLITLLNKIANHATSGVYYGGDATLHELRETMQNIQSITAKALA